MFSDMCACFKQTFTDSLSDMAAIFETSHKYLVYQFHGHFC